MFTPRALALERGWPGRIEGDTVIQLAAQTLEAFFSGGGAAREHGEYALGGRRFDFRMKPAFPRKLSREFLLVDLVNNLDRLAESRVELLERVQRQAVSVDRPRLLRAARHYGNVRTRKFFERTLTPPERLHAG